MGYVYQAWEGVWFTWKGHNEGWGRLAFDLGALLRELVQIIMLIMHGIMQIERSFGGQRLFVITPSGTCDFRLSLLSAGFCSPTPLLSAALVASATASTPIVFLGGPCERWSPREGGSWHLGVGVVWARWNPAPLPHPTGLRCPRVKFPGVNSGVPGCWPSPPHPIRGLLIIWKECSLGCRFGKSLRWPLPQLCV